MFWQEAGAPLSGFCGAFLRRDTKSDTRGPQYNGFRIALFEGFLCLAEGMGPSVKNKKSIEKHCIFMVFAKITR